MLLRTPRFWLPALLAALATVLGLTMGGVRPAEGSILADKKVAKKKKKGEAQAGAGATEVKVSSKGFASRFRGVVIVDWGTNLMPASSANHTTGSSIVLIPSFQLSSNWTVGMLASAYKEMTDLQEFTLYDPSFRVSYRPLVLNPTVSVTPAIWAVLPLSKRSRERDSLVTSVRPALRFGADFSKSRIPILKYALVSWETGIARAFHQYSTSTTGAVNTAWRLSNWINVYFAPESRWFLSGDFIRNTGWSYQGASRHSFSLGQTLGYRLTPELTLSVGHTNDGDVLRANGLTSNISVFDATSSRVFTSLMVIF